MNVSYFALLLGLLAGKVVIESLVWSPQFPGHAAQNLLRRPSWWCILPGGTYILGHVPEPAT